MPNVKTGKRRGKMVILKFVLNEEKDRIENSATVFPKLKLPKNGQNSRGWTKEQILILFFRERATSLQFSDKSDRQNSSGQEGRLFHAERATRGLRF